MSATPYDNSSNSSSTISDDASTKTRWSYVGQRTYMLLPDDDENIRRSVCMVDGVEPPMPLALDDNGDDGGCDGDCKPANVESAAVDGEGERGIMVVTIGDVDAWFLC
jgi:hypothetical protein